MISHPHPLYLERDRAVPNDPIEDDDFGVFRGLLVAAPLGLACYALLAYLLLVAL